MTHLQRFLAVRQHFPSWLNPSASVCVVCFFAALLLALPACKSKRNAASEAPATAEVSQGAQNGTADATPSDSMTSDAKKPEALQPSKAEEGEMAEAEKTPRTEQELYGAWLLERDATVEGMSLIQQKSMGPIVQEMTVALTFSPDGALAIRGVVMGVGQEESGRYEVQEIDDQTLAVRIFRDPVRGDDGEVLQMGSTRDMYAEFLGDDTLRWHPHDGQDGVEKPGQIRTLILTRAPADLEERFERAWEYDGSSLED